MSEEQEKTHVLTSDCIITEIGRCEAGTMVSEGDVLPATWIWLQERNFVKSIDEIEQEADQADEPESDDSEQSTPQPQPESKKPAAGKARK